VIASRATAETTWRIAVTPNGPISGKIVAPNAAPAWTEDALSATAATGPGSARRSPVTPAA
jgi:hypothetical protein